MAATLSVRPDRLCAGSAFSGLPVRRVEPPPIGKPIITEPWRGALLQIQPSRRGALTSSRTVVAPVQAGSRADDSAPFEMSVENAMKLLGVSEGASFDDILRAKNSILATCKDDQQTIAQVFLSFREFEC